MIEVRRNLGTGWQVSQERRRDRFYLSNRVSLSRGLSAEFVLWILKYLQGKSFWSGKVIQILLPSSSVRHSLDTDTFSTIWHSLKMRKWGSRSLPAWLWGLECDCGLKISVADLGLNIVWSSIWACATFNADSAWATLSSKSCIAKSFLANAFPAPYTINKKSSNIHTIRDLSLVLTLQLKALDWSDSYDKSALLNDILNACPSKRVHHSRIVEHSVIPRKTMSFIAVLWRSRLISLQQYADVFKTCRFECVTFCHDVNKVSYSNCRMEAGQSSMK